MNFIKSDFVIHSAHGETWVHYDNKFVARFKYMSHKAAANDFVRFLVKNFTVEEYFTKMETPDSAPSLILEEKGYVSYNIKKALRKAGYATTIEGKNQYFHDAAKAREKKSEII